MAGILKSLCIVAAVMAAGAFAVGFFQSWHPIADSFSHFRVHLAVALTICLVLVSLLSARRTRALLIAGAAALLVWVAMLAMGGPPSKSESRTLRVVQFNLNFANTAMDRAIAMLRENDADVVTLQEVTLRHQGSLSAITDLYPYQRHCPFARVGAVSILSKYPFKSASGGCAEGLGLAWAEVEHDTMPFTIASIHTYWPWPYGQHSQIDQLIPWLSSLKAPLIVAGDFNAAPWSHAVSRIEEASRTRIVPGLRMTIGVRLFDLLPAVPVPIDHVLLSGEFCAKAARVEGDAGSDHWPLVVDIGPRPGAADGPCE